MQSLSSGGKFFYDMKGSYQNASMKSIAQRLPEFCKSFAKIRALLMAPSMG